MYIHTGFHRYFTKTKKYIDGYHTRSVFNISFKLNYSNISIIVYKYKLSKAIYESVLHRVIQKFQNVIQNNLKKLFVIFLVLTLYLNIKYLNILLCKTNWLKRNRSTHLLKF